MSQDHWSFSQQFSSTFASDASALETRLNAAELSGSVSNDILASISAELSRLTRSLADAVGSLPSYDQKGYESQLKTLESHVEALRKASRPASKFAFKRGAASKAADPSPVQPRIETSQAPSAPSSRSLIVDVAGLSDQIVIVDSPPDAEKDLLITQLNKCFVNLLDHTSISAVHVRNVRNTVILLPAIRSSIMLHDLENVVIVVGCHQFRMHTSHNVDVYLAIPSQPIIEHCTKIRFAGYPAALKSASEIPSDACDLDVQDFSHIKQTPSPNWSAMSSTDAVRDWSTSESLEAILRSYLPTGQL